MLKLLMLHLKLLLLVNIVLIERCTLMSNNTSTTNATPSLILIRWCVRQPSMNGTRI